MRERKRYVDLELEVIEFEDEDVVCTSGEDFDTKWLKPEDE